MQIKSPQQEAPVSNVIWIAATIVVLFVVVLRFTDIVTTPNNVVNNVRRNRRKLRARRRLPTVAIEMASVPTPGEEAQEAREAATGLAGEDQLRCQEGPHQSGAGGPGAQAESTARDAW